MSVDQCEGAAQRRVMGPCELERVGELSARERNEHLPIQRYPSTHELARKGRELTHHVTSAPQTRCLIHTLVGRGHRQLHQRHDALPAPLGRVRHCLGSALRARPRAASAHYCALAVVGEPARVNHKYSRPSPLHLWNVLLLVQP